MKHFVTDGQNKAKIHYSIDGHCSGKPCITLYSKDYGYDLDKIFENVENNSDGQTDYFEKSRVRFFEDSPYYTDARNAAIKAQEAWKEHYNKIQSKRNRKSLKLVS
jgi:hypothetical protein